MQSESDSDNEFFDAAEKLNLSESFSSDSRGPKDEETAQKDVVDGLFRDHSTDISLKDQTPGEDSVQAESSVVEQTKEADIIKTHGESTAFHQSTSDLGNREETSDASLPFDMTHNDCKLDSEVTDPNSSTDFHNVAQACLGEREVQSDKMVTKETTESTVTKESVGSNATVVKKTEFAKSKTDASQIVADVVESIEQESAPPVAPPRRRKKKKKASIGDQKPGSPTPSESTGPDSAVSTPTEPETHIPARVFAKAVLSNEQDSTTKEFESQTTGSNQDNLSIHVDANNKEMKTVLDRTSSTEVIPALTLDSRLKSDSVASINSAKSDSYGSVASNLSNGISEKAGSFTSVASSFSVHQPFGSHHGLVRYRSASGRPLSDIEILEQVMVKNLDTGEAVPLSVAEEKLPKCTNPLALQIMRLTSEYSSNPDLANQDNEDGLERKAAKKTKKLKKFFGKKAKKPDKPAKARKEDSSSSDEETPQDSPAPLIKIKSGHGKGPPEFEKLRILQDLSGEHVGAVWTIKFTLCGRLMATAGQDHMVRVWVLKESQGYFEEMRAKYSKTGDNSSSEQEPNSEEYSQMEETLKGGEENTVDAVEGQTETSEASEEPVAEAPVEEDLGPYMKTPLCTYCGHTGDVLDLSWSKNYFLLSSSMDKTVRLWHISRSECLCCFQHIDFVTAICFHPRDDRYFLSGSLDGKIRLWNIPDKKVALWNEVEGTGSNLITAANFCLNGKFAVVGTYDGRCIFYETERLKYHTQWQVRAARNKKARGRKISGIEPMPGEDKVLITSNDSRIRLYDLKDNSLNCKYKGCVNTSSQIKAGFSHDGQYVICGSEDHFVYIWRTQHGFPSSRRDKNEFYESFSAHAVVVTAAMFAPVPWLIVPPDSSVHQTTTEVLVTADWSGAIKLFVNR